MLLPVPEFEIMSTTLELSDEQSSMVTVRIKQSRNTEPGRGNHIGEASNAGPVIVEAKDRRLGNGCSRQEKQLTVIKNRCGERGNGSVGEI